MHREFYYRWEWDFQSPPEKLWPYVADTDRVNRDTQVPAVRDLLDEGEDLNNAYRKLRFTHMGVVVEWEEEPFEWVYPSRFGVIRRFLRGPVKEMRVRAELTPHPDGGSHMTYEVWAQPRNAAGLIAIPLQIGIVCPRRFSAAFHKYDRIASQPVEPLDLPIRVQFASGGPARLARLRQRLLDEWPRADPVLRLIERIEKAEDFALAHIRPYALADQWGFPRQEMLELCLYATRAGLLELQWDLLCPLCRGTKATASSMQGIQTQVHCEACNIDFHVNFERLVEVTFRPNPTVRPLEIHEYCLGGPQMTPHIVAQQLLPPRTERTLMPALEEGRYRIRAMNIPGGQLLRVSPSGASAATLKAMDDGWPDEEMSVSPLPTFCLSNDTDEEHLLILERMAWSDQAATAAEVIVLQTFRDLFSQEALRPGDRISVGTLTILFTDLRSSTQLYREVGDAPAFGHVMNHFDVLREAVAQESGSIVKTIGDAIMGAFRNPTAAIRAVMKAQEALAHPTDGSPPLMLKAGLHQGPCIAVTLNDRLDYFGSTVNFASRLEGLSNGEDVIISSAVRSDPEVCDFLSAEAKRIAVERFESSVKGFDEEQFEFFRVKART
jgi:class 3 adenylate cyclase